MVIFIVPGSLIVPGSVVTFVVPGSVVTFIVPGSVVTFIVPGSVVIFIVPGSSTRPRMPSSSGGCVGLWGGGCARTDFAPQELLKLPSMPPEKN